MRWILLAATLIPQWAHANGRVRAVAPTIAAPSVALQAGAALTLPSNSGALSSPQLSLSVPQGLALSGVTQVPAQVALSGPQSVSASVGNTQSAGSPVSASHQAAVGTPGVYTPEFHETRTNPRIQQDIEAGRYLRLAVENGKLEAKEAGTALKPGTMARVSAKAKSLGEALKGFNGSELILLEAAEGSPQASHPRVLAVSEKDFQLAHAGTHKDAKGRPTGKFAYLTAELFADEAAPAPALVELLREEFGHADDRFAARSAGKKPAKETFGDNQRAALGAFLSLLRAEFASGRTADPVAAAKPKGLAGWIWSGLKAVGSFLRHGPEVNHIPWKFKPKDHDYYYHGTTLEDLSRIVASGGIMKPEVSQYSLRSFDSMEYGRRRQGDQAAAGHNTPMLLLQFPVEALRGKVSGKSFEPAISAMLAAGMNPMHAAYVAAEEPIPLSLMTEESKQSILSWMEDQRLLHPEDASWDAKIVEFRTALQPAE